MEQLLEQIAYCIEFGKVDKKTPYPPDMKGQDGADELTTKPAWKKPLRKSWNRPPIQEYL